MFGLVKHWTDNLVKSLACTLANYTATIEPEGGEMTDGQAQTIHSFLGIK